MPKNLLLLFLAHPGQQVGLDLERDAEDLLTQFAAFLGQFDLEIAPVDGRDDGDPLGLKSGHRAADRRFVEADIIAYLRIGAAVE